MKNVILATVFIYPIFLCQEKSENVFFIPIIIEIFVCCFRSVEATSDNIPLKIVDSHWSSLYGTASVN